MKNDYFKSNKNNISSRRKNQRKKFAVIIISLIVITSLVSIPVVIYAYNTIRNLLGYDPELPCEDLPDIETVRLKSINEFIIQIPKSFIKGRMN